MAMGLTDACIQVLGKGKNPSIYLAQLWAKAVIETAQSQNQTLDFFLKHLDMSLCFISSVDGKIGFYVESNNMYKYGIPYPRAIIASYICVLSSGSVETMFGCQMLRTNRKELFPSKVTYKHPGI